MLLVLLASACSRGQGNLTPAVFVATVRQVRCQESPEPATGCFNLTITNMGQKSGSGRCTLIGSLNGNQTAGATFRIRGIGPGKSLYRYATWTGKAQAGYGGVCVPGPAR